MCVKHIVGPPGGKEAIGMSPDPAQLTALVFSSSMQNSQ